MFSEDKTVTSSSPKLSALDKLYVRAYLSSLDHIKAHKVVQPSLATHKSDNIYSRKESIQFHIALGLQESLEALSLSPEAIISKLYKEATREGGGSNHAARVTALTVLGKQLGMFQDKKESIVPVINIINYSSENKNLSSDTTSLEEIPDEPNNNNINNNITIDLEESTYSMSVPPIDYTISYLD